MTKKKHPQDRAERLQIKKVKVESKIPSKEFSGKVRRLKREAIKKQETDNDLTEAARGVNL